MHEFIGVVHLAGSALLFDILSHAWRWHQQQSGVRNIQKIK
jgi:hypothetical protein